MIEHVERLLNITAVSTEHDVWGDLNVSGTFSHPNQPFRQKPGLLTTLDRCFRLQRRAASVRPAAQTGAVAKWLRQRIANPLSPVRIRAAPFLFLYARQLWLWGRSARLSCQLCNTPCPGPRMTVDSLWLASRKEMNSPAPVTRTTSARKQKARIFRLKCLASPNRLS